MAAGWRTGSTLVQRMLSRDCFVWGEPYGQGGLLDSVGDLLRRFSDFWPEDAFFYQPQNDESRTNKFIANLYPPPLSLLDAYIHFFETLFAQPARSAGMDRWGVKTVRLVADHAYFFRWLFPKARFLFLTRNPYDAFRSYYTISKRRNVRWFDRWPDQPVTSEYFARHWVRLTASFREHAETLDAKFLRYEDLVSGDIDLGEIEEYLGLTLAREALATNPGAFPLPDDRLAEGLYNEIANHVEPLAQSLGYVPGDKKRPVKTQATASAVELDSETQTLFENALAAQQKGDATKAEEGYREILDREPNHAGAWHFRGVLRLTEGDLATAREHIERALSLCDTKPVYWNNYGAVLKETGQLREAEVALHRALELNKNYADAWANLGHVQELLELPAKRVERSYRNALKLAPDHVDANFRLADFLLAAAQHDDAVEQYRHAIELAPNRPGATQCLFKALIAAHRWKEAEEIAQSALARNPTDLENHLALATVRSGQEDFDGLKDTCRTIVGFGRHPPIWRWRHLGTCPPVFPDEDAIDEYWTRLRGELAEALAEPIYLDWRTLPQHGFTPSFNLPHHGRCCRDVREMIAGRFESAFPNPQFRARNGRPVRVGFLITAGHEGGFIRGMSGVAARLDRRFEVVVFCCPAAMKRLQKTIRRHDVRCVPLPSQFDQMVETVRAAECDILYLWKVGPDPVSYFLGMARLAPVQCTSSGCHGTTGVHAIDYYLSSPLMESPDRTVDSASHYTERLFLFDTFTMFQSRQPRPDDVSRSEFDLPEHGAIYFCPHRLAKYCPAFDRYLREILEQDTSGHVVLLAGRNEHGRDLLRQRMRQNLGEAPFRRVHLLGSLDVPSYYRLFRLATLVLDTPVYASSLTAYDAFSAGVPVLTESGPLAVQNYATGLYRCIEMTRELVAQGREDFVRRAVAIGTNPERREYLAQQITERSDVVFDDVRVIDEYERFFDTVLFQHM